MPITALTLPSIITGKKLSLPTFSIDNTGDHDTAALIQRIVDELCSACTREQYVNSGVEDAARRFMLFLNDGGDIGAIVKAVSLPKLIFNVVTSAYSNSLSTDYIVYKGLTMTGHAIEDGWNYILHGKTPDPKHYEFNPVKDMKAAAVASIQSYLKNNSTIAGML